MFIVGYICKNRAKGFKIFILHSLISRNLHDFNQNSSPKIRTSSMETAFQIQFFITNKQLLMHTNKSIFENISIEFSIRIWLLNNIMSIFIRLHSLFISRIHSDYINEILIKECNIRQTKKHTNVHRKRAWCPTDLHEMVRFNWFFIDDRYIFSFQTHKTWRQ